MTKANSTSYLKASAVIMPRKVYKMPDDRRVEFILEEVGYIGYLPQNLLYCLVCAATYNYLDPNIINTEDEFDELVKELLLTIPYDIYSGSPLQKAIEILKDLSTQINFRKFELRLPFQGTLDNEKHSKSDLDIDTQVFIDSSSTKQNKEQLEAFIKTVKAFEIPGADFKEYKIKYTRNRMNSYGDITKINPKEFARPDFKLNFALQNITVKKHEKDVEEISRNLVFIRDSSYSMLDYMGILKGILYKIAESGRAVEVFSVYKEFSDATTLLTRSEILEYADGNYRFQPGDLPNFSRTIDCLLTLFPHQYLDVIILTDGTEKLDASLLGKGKTKFHIINTGETASSLQNLARRSNGTYLEI